MSKGTAYKSLDISAFTGIPNKVGIYEYKEDGSVKQNKYSYDDTVDAMIRDSKGPLPKEFDKL